MNIAVVVAQVDDAQHEFFWVVDRGLAWRGEARLTGRGCLDLDLIPVTSI